MTMKQWRIPAVESPADGGKQAHAPLFANRSWRLTYPGVSPPTEVRNATVLSVMRCSHRHQLKGWYIFTGQAGHMADGEALNGLASPENPPPLRIVAGQTLFIHKQSARPRSQRLVDPGTAGNTIRFFAANMPGRYKQPPSVITSRYYSIRYRGHGGMLNWRDEISGALMPRKDSATDKKQ